MPKTSPKSAKEKSAADGKKSKKTKRRWLGKLITIFFILLVIATGWYFYQRSYADKVLPRVVVGSLKLDGLTYLEAKDLVSARADKILEEGITFIYQDEVVVVDKEVVSTADPDINYEIFNYDIEQTIDNIYRYGHSANLLINWKDLLVSIFKTKKLQPVYTLNQKELKEILQINFSQYENPAQDAQLTFVGNEPGVGLEKDGQAFDYNQLLQTAQNHLANLSTNSIELGLVDEQPKIKAEMTDRALELAREVISLASISVKYANYHWLIDQEELKKMLKFKQDSKTNLPTIGFNENLVDWLVGISAEVNVEVKEGKFTMEGDRVVEFQPSQIGQELGMEQTIALMEQDVLSAKGQETGLVVEEVLPNVATEQINTYGIKELIGRGTSDFSGSPRNRRHNISVGASTLNGILVKPDEEFSLVQALGEIEASTGYLPELVIKGNQTIPEYGGGLCQIGTTGFRVALDAGLPITARTPHSYRVSYYEPAGTDATIYNPAPDLKFINDTGHYILFITSISGNELIFEFYGTADGRQVSQTKPRIFNYVKPPATKIVETEDLALGERKCTERAHTGADTEFIRTITQADGTVKNEVWESHYKPWQEVCLLGVEPGTLTEEKEE